MTSAPAASGILAPALDRVLEAFAENIADRGRTSLGEILYDRVCASDSQAWTCSRLTGDGFPVEINFTSADDRLRYTAEPASWSIEPQHRCDRAIQLVHSLSTVA